MFNRNLNRTLEKLLMKASEIVDQNNAIAATLTGAEQRITDKLNTLSANEAALQAAVANLTAELANVELTPEQAASVVAVQDAANAINAIVPV